MDYISELWSGCLMGVVRSMLISLYSEGVAWRNVGTAIHNSKV